MIAGWRLPADAVIGGKRYEIHSDYRDVLEIFAYFSDPDLPDYLKWSIALALFYEGQIPEADQAEAIQFMSEFFSGGRPETEQAGPKLLDWQQDADLIVADINKAAGREIRALPHLHWWTFLSWFHAIGDGQLSTVVAIREKLARGKKLEGWEKEYYREHKRRVELPKRYSQQELQQRQQLQLLLD